MDEPIGLPTQEALVQCCECGHVETRRSGLGTFAYLECNECGGAVEVLTINGVAQE